MNDWELEILRCPRTHQRLTVDGRQLVTEQGERTYAVSGDGIAQFADEFITEDALAQQQHYDHVADAYIRNLDYPHTQEYLAYLDRAFLKVIGDEKLGTLLEVCCGAGEAGALLPDRCERIVGVDISMKMLEGAKKKFPDRRFGFHQADATALPIASESIDNAIIFGGIHHINARQELFSEIHRVLKPGGRLFFREPVDDFFLWRWIRAVIYRFAPALDHETEAPLRLEPTRKELDARGFRDLTWETYGFVGFCLFMNSDVLVFNRLFKYLPFIRAITRGAAAVDEAIRSTPLTRLWGLIVVGSVRKSAKS